MTADDRGSSGFCSGASVHDVVLVKAKERFLRDRLLVHEKYLSHCRPRIEGVDKAAALWNPE
jgi:hypothetical protein